MVAVAAICLKAHLTGRALCHNKLGCLVFLQHGAVEAKQVVTEHRGKEEVKPQTSDMQELQHAQAAKKREASVKLWVKHILSATVV